MKSIDLPRSSPPASPLPTAKYILSALIMLNVGYYVMLDVRGFVQFGNGATLAEVVEASRSRSIAWPG